jgi:hypothetical protein
MISFQLATEEHARTVQQNLRAVDRLEVERSGGVARTCVETSLKSSLIAWAMLRDGRPIAVFGAAPFQKPSKAMEQKGVVWLLGTDELTHAGKSLVQKGHYYVDLMLRLFPAGLMNAIDPENIRTRRWLRALGFVECGHWTSPANYTLTLIQKEPHV